MERKKRTVTIITPSGIGLRNSQILQESTEV